MAGISNTTNLPGKNGWPLLWLTLFLCALSGAVWADGERIVDGYPIQQLAITEEGGELGVEANYIGESREFDGGDSLDYSNLSFEEYLRYRFSGYVYHPRFLTFRSQFKLGFYQQMIKRAEGPKGDEEDESSSAVLREYDIYVRILKDHLLSADINARDEFDVVRQLFSDQISVRTQDQGVYIFWKKAPVPMDLNIRRHWVRQDGIDSRSVSTNNILEYTARHNYKDYMKTKFRYRYQDYEQWFRAETPYMNIDRDTELQNHDVTVDNRIEFGPNKQHSLQSVLRLFHQSGNQDFTNFSWRERVDLRHSDTLKSYYLLNYLHNDFEDSALGNLLAEAGVDHRLFKSLDTHLDLHWRQTDYDYAEDTELGVTGRVNYRKETPLGFLTAGYGVTMDQVDRSGVMGMRRVVDEAVTLRTGTTAYLSKPNVISGSIMVRDTSRLETYTALDYELETRGNRTGLRLPPVTAELDDGDTVLVSYDVETSDDIEYDTTNQNFHVRHDFERGALNGLATYARWEDISHSGDTRDLSLLGMERTALGMAYNWRGFTWTEEFENFQSNFTEYDQFRSQIEGAHPLTQSVNWGWHVGYLNTDYAGTDALSGIENDTDYLYSGASLRGRIRSRGFWRLEARARRETGVSEETMLGLLGKVGMKWRKMQVNMGFQVEQRERFESDRDRVHVFFGISREL